MKSKICTKCKLKKNLSKSNNLDMKLIIKYNIQNLLP